MTQQMGTNQPRRTAEHTPRQPPDPVSYWLIAEKQNNRMRRRNISAESVWFAPMPSGGGIAIVCLEAEDLVANPLENNQVGKEELSCRSLHFLGGVGG